MRMMLKVLSQMPTIIAPPLDLLSTLWARRKLSGRGRRAACRAQGDGTPDLGDRLIASFPYVLPLMDSFPFGKFVLVQYPFFLRAIAPVTPLFRVYTAFPFASLIVFVAIYAGMVNNYSLSKFVRFNALQAVLLDILLIIPQVIIETAFKQPDGGIALQIYIVLVNSIFLFVGTCVAYGMGSSLAGQLPRLPLVAEAADSQIKDGPFGW